MIIDKARELGIALSETAEFAEMLRTRAAVEGDGELTRDINTYNYLQNELVEYMSLADEGDEGAREKIETMYSKLGQLQEKLTANTLFAEMMAARNEFEKLLKAVNDTIGACIGAEPARSCGDCGECEDDCSSCHGCVH